jgi:hypothetical protein
MTSILIAKEGAFVFDFYESFVVLIFLARVSYRYINNYYKLYVSEE